MMRRLAIRSARANGHRFVLTTIAVVVGVAFATGSFVLTDSLAASINRLLSDATSQTDFVIRGTEGVTGGRGGPGGPGGGLGGFGTPRSGLDEGLLAQVAALPAVDAADPAVIGAAQLLDKGGNAEGFDISAISNWPDHPEMSAVRLVSGRAPTAAGEVVIDTATAAERGMAVGDTVRIGTRRGITSSRVVGVAQRGAGDLGAAGTIVAVTLPQAIDLVGLPGRIDSISVKLRPGTDADAAQAALVEAVGPDAVVASADALLADARQRIEERLGNLNALMLGFAAVTLFVSAFLIWNTFSIVIAQRRRELALLRAVGASTRQVMSSIVGEAAVVGVVSSVVGLAVGVAIAVGLRRLLASFGIELPQGDLVLAPRTIAVGVTIGVGVTLVSVFGPARRTTRIPPVAAMQASALPPAASGRLAPGIGGVSLVFGLAIGATGLIGSTLDTTARLTRLGLAALLVVIGVTLVARFFTGRVVGWLGVPFVRLGGVASGLARRNAVRDPRRTAATASALMIGLALVSMTLVVGESVKTAFGGALRASIRADLVLDAGGVVPFDADTLTAISATTGVRDVVPITFARAQLDTADSPGTASPSADAGDRDRRSRIGITVGDPGDLRRAVEPAFLEGSWPDDATQIAVATAFASEHELTMGSSVTVRAAEASVTLTVTGIYQRDELLDDAVAPPSALAPLATVEPVTRQVLVSAAPAGSDTLRALERATALIPNSSVFTADGYVEDQTSALDIVLGIVNVLLLFAVGVAALGIANTLALSVVERTRELGLGRAVGMGRGQLRRMIRVEGVLIAAFGSTLGIALGMAFGASISAALPPDTAVLTFPAARLVLVAVAAGLLGLAAAAVPARRAARLDVLAAIAET